MAKQFNPFHSWLGIDERLGVPTHFQLLGVKPKADDLDEFRKLVEQNYKSVAAKLDGMNAAEIGSHQKLHARLVAHVDKARKTLLDDQLRTAYIKSLREKVRQKKATKAGSTKTVETKTSSATKKRETTPTTTFDKLPAKTQTSKTFKQSSTATIKQKNTEEVIKRAVESPVTQPVIPMALPVANKVATPVAKPVAKPATKPVTQPTARPVAKPVSKRDTAAAPQRSEEKIVAEIDQLQSKARSEAIMIRSLRGQRKKSYLIPILLGAVGLLSVAGLYGLISGSDYQLSLSEAPEEQSPEGNNDSAPSYNPAVGETPVAQNDNATSTPDDSLVSQTEQPASSAPESPSPSDVAMGSGTNMGSATNNAAPEIDLEPVLVETASPQENTAEAMPEPVAETEAPAFFSKTNFDSAVFFLGRARSEMKRGRIDSAKEQLRIAKNLIRGAKGQPSREIGEAIADGQSVAGILDGFWSQVAKSSRSYEGLDLQPSPGTIIGFVEGRENDVVVKIGGETFAVPYRSLRPGLAMELASKGEGRDLDQWGLQQAAFRIVHASGSAKSTQAIEGLLSEAETAGLSTDPLRRFWDNDFLSNSRKNQTVDKQPYQPRSLKPMVKKIVAGKYTNMRRLDAETARSIAIELSSGQYKDASMRVAALDESIKLAAHAGDAALMIDLVDELGTIADIETGNMKAESFRNMAKRLPRDADPRIVADTFYEFIRSPDATDMKPTQLQRLKISMLDFVTQKRMTDLKRLISQSME